MEEATAHLSSASRSLSFLFWRIVSWRCLFLWRRCASCPSQYTPHLSTSTPSARSPTYSVAGASTRRSNTSRFQRRSVCVCVCVCVCLCAYVSICVYLYVFACMCTDMSKYFVFVSIRSHRTTGFYSQLKVPPEGNHQ